MFIYFFPYYQRKGVWLWEFSLNVDLLTWMWVPLSFPFLKNFRSASCLKCAHSNCGCVDKLFISWEQPITSYEARFLNCQWEVTLQVNRQMQLSPFMFWSDTGCKDYLYYHFARVQFILWSPQNKFYYNREHLLILNFNTGNVFACIK